MLCTRQDFPVALTFDIDWAPDFAIQKCIDLLQQYGIPGTFFVTHKSELIRDLSSESSFELGIHPNFLSGSSHGDTIDKVLDNMFELCPQASSLRTHGLYQTSNLYFHILSHYKQIKYDFSLLLADNPFLFPFNFKDSLNNSLLRVPYQWEDDVFFLESDANKISKNIIFKKAIYQIFDFHPIHLYLNSENSNRYELLKKKMNCRLPDLKEENAKDYINLGEGTLFWLRRILENIPKERFVLASDIPALLKQYGVP